MVLVDHSESCIKVLYDIIVYYTGEILICLVYYVAPSDCGVFILFTHDPVSKIFAARSTLLSDS